MSGKIKKQDSKKKISILIIAPSPQIVGGQSTQAQRLLKNFGLEEDLEMSFVPIDPRCHGIIGTLEKLKYVRTIIRTIHCILLLLRHIPKNDIIHLFSAAHVSFFLTPTPAILLARVFRKKTILNYRSGEAKEHLTNWPITKKIIQMCEKVVTPSEYLVDVFKPFGIDAISIYNIVPLEKFPYKERSSIKPKILTNRLLEPLYNVDCVIKAFALIQTKYPDAVLTVSADGEDRPRLERLVKEMDLKNATFTGFVTNEEMAQLYNNADIYMISPNIDNMPGSVIECQSTGLPVVSTGVGGIPYIVEHERTGLLVQKDDHTELAKQAMRLLDDTALAQRIISCSREEVKKYAWENVREQWLGLYRELSDR